ncbi:uncharacterized protein [Aristolochia californica]|uniref:uncharacterized protein n=1 Tax=Aristolochia californica TaxID=171875 RepID=UPI0035E166B4
MIQDHPSIQKLDFTKQSTLEWDLKNKRYYHRPTPQDLLYEENLYLDKKSYDGRTIYEWSIDGLSEYQIMEHCQRMLMYATICRQHKNSDQGIVEMLTAGFSGILKDDAVYTLISCIVHHFIGRLTSQTDREERFCNTYVVELLAILDAKYIDGLPTLFASKVRKRIGNEVGRINYQQYTYGLLTSAIIQEGLALCNDLKLQAQLKQQNLTGKHELGEFCEQFACDTGPQPCHQRKGKENASKLKRLEPYSHQSRRYPKRQSHQKTRLRVQLAKIFLNSDSGDDIDYASSSPSEDDPDCSCSHLQSVAQMHQINVLTTLQQSMLENIDQEENPQTKRYLIKEYLDQIQSTSKVVTPIQGVKPYSLKEIIELCHSEADSSD